MPSQEFQPSRLEGGPWSPRLPDVKPPCILNPWPNGRGIFFVWNYRFAFFAEARPSAAMVERSNTGLFASGRGTPKPMTSS